MPIDVFNKFYRSLVPRTRKLMLKICTRNFEIRDFYFIINILGGYWWIFKYLYIKYTVSTIFSKHSAIHSVLLE